MEVDRKKLMVGSSVYLIVLVICSNNKTGDFGVMVAVERTYNMYKNWYFK